MPVGSERPSAKFATTFSRLIALSFFVPLPVSIDLLEVLGLGDGVHVDQQALDRLGAHAAVEVVAEALAQRAVDVVVGHELLHLQALEGGEHVVEVLGLATRGLVDLLDVTLGLALGGGQLGALGALALQLLQPVLELAEALLDVLVALGLDVALLGLDLGRDAREVLVATLVVDTGDHVGREVDDALEVLGRQVEQVAQTAGHALEVPDVGDRGGQLDVAHAVATHLGTRDLHAAALTDDALEPHPLVLAAVALPVPRGPEDALAEQAVLLRLQGAVVDRLGLLDLTV